MNTKQNLIIAFLFASVLMSGCAKVARTAESAATPVKVEGDVEYLINRNARGWVVTLFNDNGVFKPQQGLGQVDRSAKVTATISLRGAGISGASDWTTNQTFTVNKRAGAPDNVTVNIAAGGIAVVELRAAR